MADRDLILSGYAAIANYMFGDGGKQNQRRVRTLVNRNILRVKKVAGRVEARQSWVDAAYAEPDPPRGNGAEQPDLFAMRDVGECARPNCTKRVLVPQERIGRLPKYCLEHGWRPK